jgi:hypothetical protein
MICSRSRVGTMSRERVLDDHGRGFDYCIHGALRGVLLIIMNYDARYL